MVGARQVLSYFALQRPVFRLTLIRLLQILTCFLGCYLIALMAMSYLLLAAQPVLPDFSLRCDYLWQV